MYGINVFYSEQIILGCQKSKEFEKVVSETDVKHDGKIAMDHVLETRYNFRFFLWF